MYFKAEKDECIDVDICLFAKFPLFLATFSLCAVTQQYGQPLTSCLSKI